MSHATVLPSKDAKDTHKMKQHLQTREPSGIARTKNQEPRTERSPKLVVPKHVETIHLHADTGTANTFPCSVFEETEPLPMDSNENFLWSQEEVDFLMVKLGDEVEDIYCIPSQEAKLHPEGQKEIKQDKCALDLISVFNEEEEDSMSHFDSDFEVEFDKDSKFDLLGEEDFLSGEEQPMSIREEGFYPEDHEYNGEDEKVFFMYGCKFVLQKKHCIDSNNDKSGSFKVNKKKVYSLYPVETKGRAL